MKRQYEMPVKRLEKLSKENQLDLAFDLINAIASVRSPVETANFLRDLFTSSEIKNLGKRLRIAKLLLAGKKQEEILEILHCSFATIAKVNTWLNQGGEGFKKVIAKLPKQYEISRLPYSTIYNVPDTLIAAAGRALASKQSFSANNQKKRLEKFTDKMADKEMMDKSFQEAVDERYRNK